MWQYKQIDFKCEKTHKGKVTYMSIYFFYNPRVPAFQFRCQATRDQSLDRLIAIVVTETGNTIEFDELATKETITLLNLKTQKKFKDIQIYHRDGIIKILMKIKFSQKKLHSDQTQPYKSGDFFLPRLQKLREFLYSITPDLQTCSKIIGKKGFTGYGCRYGYSLRKDKFCKSLQIGLCQDIRKILSAHEESIDQCLHEIKKKKQNFLDQRVNWSVNENLQKYMYNLEIKETGDEQKRTNIYQIQEVTLGENVLKKQTGGACQLQKRKAKTLVYLEDGYRKTKKNKSLIVKKPREDEKSSEKSQEYLKRFQRQKHILRYLSKTGKKQYLLNYYEEKDNDSILYIDYLDLNLNEFLYYYRQFLTASEIFSICKQLFQIIQDLHLSGVVHRDLKPSNFMVDTSGKISLKLIDFSDSSIINEDVEDQRLCGTLPYSPLESSKSFLKKHKIKGINNKEIDYWSVGILLYQIFYGYLPMTYSPCLAKDIHSLWLNEFLYIVKSQKKRGLKIVNSGFQLLNFLLVRVNPEERVSLGKAYIILCFLEKYYEDLKSDLCQK